MDSKRRTLLASGAAATAMAAAGSLAQQAGQGAAAKKFYEKGGVRIHYEETGKGFPLLCIPGGGLNSTIAWMAKGAPFNVPEEFKSEYRVVTADLRNAYDGQSRGRSMPTARGTRTPTISSASWSTSATRNSW